MDNLLPVVDWDFQAEDHTVENSEELHGTFLFWNRGYCYVVHDTRYTIRSIVVRHAARNWEVDFFRKAVKSCLENGVGIRKVIIADDKILLIPEALFNEEEATIWFMKLHHTGNAETVYFEKVPEFNLVVAYAFLDSLKELFREAMGAAVEVKNLSAITLKNENFTGQEGKVGVQLFLLDDVAAINVVSDRKLLLHQVFCYQSVEDIAYKIVLAAEQHDLNANDLSVTLLGIHNELEAFAMKLRQYFPMTVVAAGNDGPSIYFLKKILECA